MKLFKVFFLALISNFVFCNDMKVEIRLEDNSKSWDVGEIKTVKLRMYPIINVDPEYTKEELLSKDFLDLIKFTKILDQGPLKENPEYYDIKLEALLVKAPKYNYPKLWSYNNLIVPVTFVDFEFLDEPAKLKSLYVFEKKLDTDKSSNYLLLIVVLIILVMIALPLVKKIKEKRRIKMVRLNTINTLKNVKDRRSHEQIYINKKDYYSILENVDNFEEYLSIMNEIQYKKVWSDEDTQRLKSSYEKVKESILDK